MTTHHSILSDFDTDTNHTITQCTKHSQGLIHRIIPPLSTVNGHMYRIISESPQSSSEAVFSNESFMVLTPDVSLGVFSL